MCKARLTLGSLDERHSLPSSTQLLHGEGPVGDSQLQLLFLMISPFSPSLGLQSLAARFRPVC